MSTWTTEDRQEAEKTMNNEPALKGEPSHKAEPVAWINREEGSGSILDWEKDPYADTNIPLYTHPAKTLTDEEIVYLAKRFEGVWSGEVDYKGFARAILRKAQE